MCDDTAIFYFFFDLDFNVINSVEASINVLLLPV